jgi:peptidyl-prolyl cis-trans isomerase C
MRVPPVRAWLRAALAEPMVHFVVIGALIFGVHARLRPARDRIVISAAFVDALRQEHARRTGKPPTEDEARGLVERYVDEEVLYREALALGLDRGDVIVRRRLVQKMEFVTQAAAPAGEPSDADLSRWVDAHADRYREAGAASLRHVFLSRDRRGDALTADAARLLAEVRGGADPGTLGDPFLHGSVFARRTARDLEATFGRAFAEAVSALPAGAWSDPIASSYGLHLVLVTERSPGGAPRLDDVRARARLDWLDQRREEANRATLRRLRDRYPVELEHR